MCMIQGFYTAGTALRYRQKGIDVVSNNIANVNTKGYKKNRANFEDALYSTYLKEYPDGENTHYDIGCGSYVNSIERDFSQGNLVESEGNLDIALSGDGFIGVLDDKGNTLYTRGGSFSFSPASRGYKYIVNEDGYFLSDYRGNKIKIRDEISEINIDDKGEIHQGDSRKTIKIELVNFPNPDGLIAQGYGMYAETPYSGKPDKNEDVNVRQGFLEMSNVDTANEMVDLIKNQRIFSMNSKVIQTIDEMQSLANKLRR